jgi:hypothetical protein
MKKVVAKALGFHGGQRRRPGDVFFVADDDKGSWFEPAVDPREELKEEIKKELSGEPQPAAKPAAPPPPPKK